MSGTLYLVATPIGNLSDISERALKTLNEVDFIAAEDTRVTIKLLNRYNISKQLVSYYEHNKKDSGEKIVSRLLSGESCALVTDAGMPAISDPGEDLVKLCAAENICVSVIPGPCAAVSALSVSGLTTGRFCFEGFLSTSKKSRFSHLEELKTEHRTMIFYEAPHKLIKTLADMLSVWGDRAVSISREMTKIHEETLRGSLSEMLAHFESTPPKGEFVLVIEGAERTEDEPISLDDALALTESYIQSGMSIKDAAKKCSEETGVSKNAIYRSIIKGNLL